MSRIPWRWSGSATALLAGLLLAGSAWGQFWFSNKPMPEFRNQAPAAWINSKPLTREALAGKVVLIEVWAAG
jgi:hypothetical protein